MNFTKKSELNKSQVWLNSGNSEKLGRIIVSLLPVFGGKNAENLWNSDSGQRRSFWCVFGLIRI